ncbi:hypothetical protein RI129_006650 [Pyrocoelia pectoralis]|uniref:MADF domain-containing protein n=1 Tax=Pyrocoelia pectoralis TaxID=417401 RepID=A0AAN7ZGC4_9COLE
MATSKNTVFTWSRDITTDLITLYEGQPVLYVTRLKEYKNKNKRAEAVSYMQEQLQEKYPMMCATLSNGDVLKKIHTLRTQYLKEVGVCKKFLVSGASAEAYKPKLWCFDMLNFLSEGDPVRDSQSNLELTVSNVTNLMIATELKKIEDRKTVQQLKRKFFNAIMDAQLHE